MSCALCRRPPGMHLLPQDASQALVAEVEACVARSERLALGGLAEEDVRLMERAQTAPQGRQGSMFG